MFGNERSKTLSGFRYTIDPPQLPGLVLSGSNRGCKTFASNLEKNDTCGDNIYYTMLYFMPEISIEISSVNFNLS